jgi:hypothetical protein
MIIKSNLKYFIPTLFLVYIIFSFIIPQKNIQAQNNDILTLVDEQEAYAIGLYLDILEDTEGKLTIDDVTGAKYVDQFVRSEIKVPNYSYTSSVYWVRIEIKNEATTIPEWFLEIDAKNSNFLDFYRLTPEGMDVFQTGTSLAFETRPYPYDNFVFDLPFDNSDVEVVYVRMESSYPMVLFFNVFSAKQLFQKIQRTTRFDGFTFGALFVVFAYNAFIYLLLRDKSYLYYLVFIFSYIVMTSSAGSLYMYRFVFPQSPQIRPYIIEIAFIGLFVSSLRFTQTFLQTSDNASRSHRMLNVLVIISFMLGVAILFVPWAILLPIILLWVTVIFTIQFVVSLIVWRTGFRAALFYLCWH